MSFNENLNPEWIQNGINDHAVEWSRRFAKHLAPDDNRDRNALTTSQLRKFFGQLRRIEADYGKLSHEVPLLKPKLAYAVGRADRRSRIKDFYDQMIIGLNALN